MAKKYKKACNTSCPYYDEKLNICTDTKNFLDKNTQLLTCRFSIDAIEFGKVYK